MISISKKLVIIISILGWVSIGYAAEQTLTTFSDRKETFMVSEIETFPTFCRELIIDPFKVKVGEKQVFSCWVKDPQGIEKVVATTQTDKGTEVFNLKLTEGTEKEGRWQGSWRTKDISESKSYSTQFQAINKQGRDTKITCTWYLKEVE